MAEDKKKKPVERKVISAEEAKKSTKKPSTKKAADEKEEPVKAEPKELKGEKKGNAKGLRIGAFVLWLFAILCEVAAILLLNRTLSLPGELMTWLIVAIVADLVLVIVGAQLWKKSNRIDPASEKNKFKFWLWNNMGVIVSVIAFVPMIVLLLKNKELDAKTKKIVSIIAAVALVIAGGASYDFNPVSQEDQEAMRAEAMQNMDADGDVFWTPFGKSYHMDENCQSLQRSATLINGTLDEAFEAKRFDPCDFCAGGADATVADTVLGNVDETVDEAA